MKKVLTLILVLSMVLGSIGAVFAAPALEDVIDTVYEDAVIRLASLGILEGYPDGTFKPDNTITRAEYAAAVIRAKGLEYAALASVGATEFTDVPATHWAAGYINVAAKTGLVNGMGDGTYAPEAPITYEQAVTLVTRALGYEPAAQSKGGYPYGYLIAAAENGLLEKVRGTQGAPAPRGLVAQLLDNALEIPLMVRVTYGDRTEYIISGTRGVEEKTLLDEMDFVSIEGEVTDIARISSLKKNQIRINNKTYKVVGNVDYEAVFGTEVKAWLNVDDEVVFVKIESDDILFDAVKMDGKKLKLIDAGDKYELARGAKIYVDGKRVDELEVECGYAKVVLNDDGDVAFIDAYVWVDFLVVEEVDGNYVYGYGDEVNAKDFTVVKDGRTIGLDDLEEGDIFFYTTAGDGYAEVFNNYVEGKIERIYDNSIKVGGKEYKRYDAKYLNEDDKIKYIDSSSLLKDIAEAMQDAGEVAVFLNRAGDMVFLTGDIGDLKTSSDFVLLTADSVYFSDRGTKKWTFDIFNAEGVEVKYDVKEADIDKISGLVDKANWENKIKKCIVTELRLDTKGKIDEIKILQNHPESGVDIKTSEKYYGGKKIDPNAVVYLVKDFLSSNKVKDIEVEFYKDLDFDYIKKAEFYEKDDKIVAIVVEDSSRKDDNVTYLTVATADGSKVAGKNQYTLKLVLNGEKVTVDTKVDIGTLNIKKGDLLEVKVDKKTDLVNEVSRVSSQEISGAVSALSTTDKSLKIGDYSNIFKLGVDGVVVDATDSYKVITLSTLKNGDSVKALRVTSNSNYLDVIVRTAKRGDTPPGPIVTEGVVSYIDETLKVIYVDSVPYVYGAGSIVKSPKGSIIAVGTTGFEAAGTYELAVNDEVTDIKVTDGVITSLVANKIATVQTAAVTAVINTLNSNELNPAHADFNKNGNDVTNARSAYDALTAPAPAQKDYVTNYDKLVAAEAAIASVDAVAVAADKAALTVTYDGGAGPITLATTGAEGSTISWASSDPATITTGGVVTQPLYSAGAKTVTLTATITKGTVTDTKVFTVTVNTQAMTADDKEAADKAALTIPGDLNNVTANLTLAATGENGSTITWTSSNTAIVEDSTGTAGKVLRPAGANVQVTLTALINAGGTTQTKVFYVTVLGE